MPQFVQETPSPRSHSAPDERTADVRPAFAWGPVLLVALGVVLLHASVLTRYGWFRDELYYVSCARRLAWGYVDQPPLSIAVLAALRTLFGDGLAVLRLAAAALAAGTALLAAALARELGGGRFAQLAAALVVSAAPIVLGFGHYYSMNDFDYAFWLAALVLYLRATRGEPGQAPGAARRWLALGAVLGLGLLDKWSVLWLGAGLAAALMATPARRWLRTPGPWLAAAVAAVLVAPNLLWEVRNGWPTAEFVRNASLRKLQPVSPAALFLRHLLLVGPGAVPLWGAGLAWSVRGRGGGRALAIVWAVTLAVLVAQGHARAEYLTLAAVPLLVAGAVWLEARGRAARTGLLGVALALVLPILPAALPILSPPGLVAWQRRFNPTPATEERQRTGPLPQHEADQFGWPELADSVARVAATRLTSDERARAITVVGNYGEAGALEQFGRGRVPPPACQHNNWYLWGPPRWDGRVAIVVSRDSAGVRGAFEQAEVVAVAGHPLAMPYERDLPIWIARRLRGDLATAWRAGKDFQ